MENESSSGTQSIVALAIGVISLVAVIIPYGGLLGIVGIIVASKALRRGSRRSIARFGMTFSVLAIVSTIFLFFVPAFLHT